ncbi:hypothetical protein N7520_005368 [Penicillium odoratum]|uniref:uncharacterized protein n=1 Tax=Penicillium odoratum TaxID=1167516 RepID=UPI0025475B0B|nr:uncharacterized protein N7520_005368 [Penicillium odoratum]KAJ5765809.1 hypothetical protein N7520_005368 [Penicillium odoratum]
MSRMLGRPAKKKSSQLLVEGSSPTPETFEDLEFERTVRRTSRKKANRPGKVMRPRAAKKKYIPEELSSKTLPDIDEPDMSTHYEAHEPTCHPSFEMNFTSENWTQPLMPIRMNDDPLSPVLEQTYAEMELEDTFITPSECTRNSTAILIPPSGDPCSSSTPLAHDMNLNQCDPEIHNLEQMTFLELKEAETTPWAYAQLNMQSIQDAWMLESPHQSIPVLVDPSYSSYHPLQSPDTSPDSELYSADEPGLLSPPHIRCSCYKHATSELISSGERAEEDGSSSFNTGYHYEVGWS